MREASGRWLGITEPILPVGDGGTLAPLWRQILEYANVRALVTVDLEAATCSRLGEELGLPVVSIDHIDHTSPSRYSYHPSILDESVNPPNSPLSFLDEISRGSQWTSASEDSSLWEIAGAGLSNQSAQLSPANLDSSIYIRRQAAEIGWAEIGGRSLLNRTTQRTFIEWASPGQFPSSAVFWFCDEESELDDCIHFWNRRALNNFGPEATPIFLFPSWDVANWTNFRAHLEGLLGSRREYFEPDVMMISQHTSHARLIEIAESWGLVKGVESVNAVWTSPPPPLQQKPFTYEYEYDPTSLLLYKRRYGIPVDVSGLFFQQSANVEVQSPISNKHFSQALMRVESPIFEPYPRRNEIADCILKTSVWNEDALETVESSFIKQELSIVLPPMAEVTSLLLGRQCENWALSDKGKTATAIANIGHSVPLEEEWVFSLVHFLRIPRSKEAIRLFEKNRSENDLSIGEDAVSMLAQSSRGRGQSSLRTIRAHDSSITLENCETLVTGGWLERGLLLECSTCLMNSFVEMSDVSAAAICPGCRSRGKYASAEIGLEIFYRLNSLLQHAINQGALQQYLSAYSIVKQSSYASHLIPGVLVVSQDDRESEVDLFGVVNGQVVSGEVKTSAGEFKIENIDSDLEKSMGLEADWHLFVCLQNFPEGFEVAAQRRGSELNIRVGFVGPNELWRGKFQAIGVGLAEPAIDPSVTLSTGP